jgi:hypothetical protein
MDSSDSKQPDPRKHLTGSKGGDVILGIVAGFLWWILGFGLVTRNRGSDSGFAVVGLILAVIILSIVLRSKWDFTGRFVLWQLLTVVLTPLIAFGLLFGACLLGGNHF